MTLRNILLLAVAATTATLTSCLDDKDSYQAGFLFRRPASNIGGVYANNTSDSVVFFSYGAWTITPKATQGGDWCTLQTRQGGVAGALWALPVSFSQNTTGQGRGVLFTIRDADHPDDASADFGFWQYATRGDGALGMAADVKSVDATDGTHIDLSYDQRHRPLSLRMTRGDELLQQLALAYNDRDSIVTITDRGKTARYLMGADSQPYRLLASTTDGGCDTVGIYQVYSTSYVAMPVSYVFRYRHTAPAAADLEVIHFNNGRSLMPDSLHVPDSIFCYAGGQLQQKLLLDYSTTDNRHQTLDVNQLLRGADHCDPYLLLSLFRVCRATSVVSRAHNSSDNITVDTRQNADGSIAQMTVTTAGAAAPVVYTFGY